MPFLKSLDCPNLFLPPLELNLLRNFILHTQHNESLGHGTWIEA